MANIYIKLLGPIKEFYLDINRINLFIGEQATGKSTVCRAVYYFKHLRSVIIEYLYETYINGESEKTIKKECKDLFVNLFGFSWKLPEELYMRYTYKSEIYIIVRISVDNCKQYLSVEFSKDFRHKLKALEAEQQTQYELNRESTANFNTTNAEKTRVHLEIERKVSELLGDNVETYYIPAGRSLLTLMTNQKTKLDYDTIDFVNRQFMQFIESIQPKFDEGTRNAHKYFPSGDRRFDATKISSEIVENLKGEYKFSRYREELILENMQSVPINFASSGQQEVLWMLNQLYILMLRSEKSFVIIEEPEAHLYPSLQKKVVEFIVQFINLTESSVAITTHSPYILTSVSLLSYAGKVAEVVNGRYVKQVLEKSKIIEPGILQAFKLSYADGGTVITDLIDTGTEEIRTECIDEISDDINEIYTKLYDLGECTSEDCEGT